MKIALDYDMTFTVDPAAWLAFAASFTAAGHEVRIVTVRDDRFDRTAELAKLESLVGVIYTRGVAKLWFCDHFGDGFRPDVWIDDKPESILSNSAFSPDGLFDWRATRDEGPHIPRDGS